MNDSNIDFFKTFGDRPRTQFTKSPIARFELIFYVGRSTLRAIDTPLILGGIPELAPI